MKSVRFSRRIFLAAIPTAALIITGCGAGKTDSDNWDEKVKGVKWTVQDKGNGTARLTGFDRSGKEPSGNIRLPTEVDGLKITSMVDGEKNGSSLFKGCEKLTGVCVPSSYRRIGNKAFQQCSKLKTVVVEDGVRQIGEYAFGECSSLSSLTLPSSIGIIEKYAFSDCSSLTEVQIPDDTEEVGKAAFARCASLKKAYIPLDMRVLGIFAFNECDELTDVYYEGTPDELKKIERNDPSAGTSTEWKTSYGFSLDFSKLEFNSDAGSKEFVNTTFHYEVPLSEYLK